MRLSLYVREPRRAWLQLLLTLLCLEDLMYLRAHPRTPPLYRSGVRYQREPRTADGHREDWQDVHECLKRRRADCEDLAAWRAAEYRAKGIKARPVLVRVGKRTLHALVRLPDGSTEDPSRRLGMRG